MHLTNSSLNKHSQQYVPNVDAEEDASGSKWSLAALKRQVGDGAGQRPGRSGRRCGGCARARARARGDKGLPQCCWRATQVVRDFGEARAAAAWEQIDDLVVKTVISVEPAMSAGMRAFVPRCAAGAHNTQCFQLFGFDVMLDASCRPWLLEVNLDPALGTESPLDLKVKSSMLIDLLNLVGVPAPPAANSASPAEVAGGAGAAASVAGSSVDGASCSTPAEAGGAATRPAAPSTADEEADVLRHVNAQFARSKGGAWRRLFPAAGALRTFRTRDPSPPSSHPPRRPLKSCARRPPRRRPLPRVS